MFFLKLLLLLLIKILNKLYFKKSLLGNNWKIKECSERESLTISQKHNLPINISKLLATRDIKDSQVKNFFEPDINNYILDPFVLKDMEKSVNRTIQAIVSNQKIGIITDYDVDGSTSAAVLNNFLSSFGCTTIIKVPDRLKEGYGPNLRLINELLDEKIDLLFTLDCGTTSFDIFDSSKINFKDVIVIDHHMSELKFPDVFAIINPNRFDENNSLKELAAVGITFLFVMALRKKLREKNYFDSSFKEPNLLNYLDLVALGTVCDVVKLTNYNRFFVHKGLEIIKKRHNKGITKIIDNSKFNHTPTSTDLGFVIGPQLNAASRIDDSNLSSKILISNNLNEIEIISKKLLLLNEKRKLIENQILNESLEQANKQTNKKFILVHGFGWHKGVLGIVASKLVDKFNKPSFVISLDSYIGIGSARSINKIDLGKIILQAKYEGILISGGGHKMAAGIKINKQSINLFDEYLSSIFNDFDISNFEKNEYFDLKISVNEINNDLVNYIEMFEPFGNGNKEPKFIIHGLKIDTHKIIKDKHLLFFFKTDLGLKFKAICFNCIGTNLGENLIKNKLANYDFGCTINRDNFDSELKPQLIIKDAIIID
mgnify:CR=1 FL=1